MFALKNSTWQSVLISKDTSAPRVSACKEQERIVNLAKNTNVCASVLQHVKIDLKLFLYLINHHAMKTYRNGGIAPRTLTSVLNKPESPTLPLYTRDNNPHCPLNRMGDPSFGEETIRRPLS